MRRVAFLILLIVASTAEAFNNVVHINTNHGDFSPGVVTRVVVEGNLALWQWLPKDYVQQIKGLMSAYGTDLTTNNQQILGSYQQSPAIYHESPAIYHKSPAIYNMGPENYHQSPASNHQSPESNQQSPASNQQSPASNQQSPKSNQQSPESNQETPHTKDLYFTRLPQISKPKDTKWWT